MATGFRSGTLSQDIWRLKKDLENQIEAGHNAQDPWEVILGKWDEMAERVRSEDSRQERDRTARNLNDSYKKLKERMFKH